MVRSSTMGRSGPKAGLAGLGYGIAAAAGWNHLMGFPGRPPVGLGPAFPDYSVNLHHLLIAVLSSLEHRRQTGEGQFVDLSQHESTITWLGPAVLDYTVNGREPEPSQNRHPFYAPHGIFPAAGDDRWIAIAVDDSTWLPLCRVAYDDGVDLAYPMFATHADRKANEDDLDELIAGWTAKQDANHLTERLQAVGVAAYPVLDGRDMVNDPQLNARQHYVRLDHPEAGERIWDRPAFRLTETPDEPRRSPLLGEDNDWLLGDLLHLSDDEIAAAYVDGAID